MGAEICFGALILGFTERFLRRERPRDFSSMAGDLVVKLTVRPHNIR